MTVVSPSSPRERILQAALRLLEEEGVEAVSTRAVSAAADVQAPTIYRQFGDMQGLLNAVASTGFASYLQAKAARPPLGDPIEDLREGWNLHVEFGLTHPHLYTLMYTTLQLSRTSRAGQEAASILHRMVQRVAEAGRLAVSVERATAMIHAAGQGVTLALLSATVQDRKVADLMREAVLTAILTPEAGAAGGSERQQAAAHAISLMALLPDLPAPFSAAEQTLLMEWLHRLT